MQNFNDDFSACQALSTSSPTYWNDVDNYFDLSNYIDYICMQAWICNTDWPYNNIKIFRGPQTKNKWRYG
ncbi:CotH kinase family protein, partial [Escherichia coli]|uniref:CotH kinase family protein n=1 Tax=Escherichia coli TaxID=562 RepID=UPI0021DB7F0D